MAAGILALTVPPEFGGGGEGQRRPSATGGARAGHALGQPATHADPRWGLAARGALVEAAVTRLVVADEARHVAFGVAHTAHAENTDPALLGRLRGAVERRHAALLETAGLNQQVYDALVLIAAGSWVPAAIRSGWEAVQRLQSEMDEGRRRRLGQIGFPADEAAEPSALHTRNLM
jgi:hypothetical protein